MSQKKKRRRFYQPRFERVEDRRLLAADLALNVTDADATVAPGGTVAYQFEYSNVGDEAASAAIRTYVPRNTALAAEGSTEGWECQDSRWGFSSCSLDLGEVGPDSSGTATLAVQVNEEVSARTRRIVIFGSISGDEVRARNNYDWSVTPVIQQLPDLSLDFSTEQEEVAPGESIAYTLDYANSGPVAAPGAAIRVAIPEHASLATEGSSEGWACEDGVCTLQIGDVAAEATGQATLAVAVSAETPTNVRSLSVFGRIGDDGSGGADANSRNNRDGDRVRVVHQVPDLSVSLSDGDVESVAAGESLVYTVDYANAGQVDAAGVMVSMSLPSGTTFTAEGSTDGWSCEEGVCSLDVGSLERDATASATLAVTLEAELRSRNLRVSASIADDGSAGEDANPRNNFDRETTRVAGDDSGRGGGFGRWFEWFVDRFRQDDDSQSLF